MKPRRAFFPAMFVVLNLLLFPIVPRLLGQSADESPQDSVAFTIDAKQGVHPISPFIYGINAPLEGNLSRLTLRREGGNRWSAYNWTNNASNAGNDWRFQNDDYLPGGNTPAGALLGAIQNTSAAHAALIVTVPMSSYVAADKFPDGDVRQSGPNYLHTRFRPGQPFKNSPFTLHPDPASPVVYQDEFVNWIRVQCPYSSTDPSRPVFFSLDNEPDLWSSTHAEVHPVKTTYAEIVDKSIQYARAVKSVLPESKVFGPVNFGWSGYVNLADAPDADHRDFQNFYLDEMKQAETHFGKRLLDVLDVHYYTEATSDTGVRAIGHGDAPGIVAARLQSTRSLWDPTYTEASWITKWSTHGPIQLLPRLKSKIAQHYPGTQLAITEYSFGGSNDISGALAQADALGIFGVQNLFAAAEWPLDKRQSFIDAAFCAYRNFDNAGGCFGDLSISAQSSDVPAATIYASRHTDHPGWLTLVAINKTSHPLLAHITLAHAPAVTHAHVYTISAQAPQVVAAGEIKPDSATLFSITLPSMSVNVVRLDAGE